MVRTLRDRDAKILVLLLALGSVAYFTLPDEQGNIGGVAKLDGYYYYIYLRSLQVDGDLDFSNEYKQWGNPFEFGNTDQGRARNVFGVGPALLWSPFFVTTHLTVRLARLAGSPLSLDGLSRFHQVGTFFGSLIYGWLALVFCYLIARRIVGRAHALWATLAAGLASPLPYYCLYGAAYSHAPAAMATSLLVLLWLRWREELGPRRWLILGAVSGLVLLVRPACFPFVILPLGEGLRQLWHGRRALRRALVGPALGALAALVVFLPQFLVWQLLFGTPLTVPQGQGFFWWSASAWDATLFGPRNGLLPSAPLLLFAVLGLLGHARRHSTGRLLLAVFAATTYVTGAVHDWWGWEFSARRFTSCLPVFAVGMAVALAWTRGRLATRPARTAAWLSSAIIGVAILFNLAWMGAFGGEGLRWYQVRSTDGLYLTVSHRIVDRIYNVVGNPLSLPSALTFSARQGEKLRRYDRLSGSYLIGEINPETNPGGDPYLQAMVDLSAGRFRPNLSEDFGNPKRDGPVPFVPLRRDEGRIYLPINRPGPLHLWLRGRAVAEGTTLEMLFNGQRVARHNLPTDWTTLAARIPAPLVRRGINRLELRHRLAPSPRPSRRVGGTNTESSVDIAVASGGRDAGRFCEIWVGDRQQLAPAVQGLNVVVIDAGSGRILGRRGFAVHRHPELYRHLADYLDAFPAGSIVAAGVRTGVGRRFAATREAALSAFARFGATTDLSSADEAGYAAIGVLGAPAGTAIERLAQRRHALVRVGARPPPWREVARYAALRLR